MRLHRTVLSIGLASSLALPAFAADPYKAADDTWITLSGKVKSASDDSFKLDYGGKEVTVEMDDFDRNSEGFLIKKGDQVTVSGRVDDDLFELASIEASSVYVKNLDTYFFASSVDEEDPALALVTITKPVTVVQGKVTSVNGREFTIDTGTRRVSVDTSAMAKNPMKQPGAQKIEKGDRVSVAGVIDRDLFEQRELMASSIVTLTNAKQQGTGGSGE